MISAVNTLTYPQDFVKRVKEEFPDEPDLHTALNDNCYKVGRFLNDSSTVKFDADEVLNAFSGGDEGLKQLEDGASAIVRRRGLFTEWQRIINPRRAVA